MCSLSNMSRCRCRTIDSIPGSVWAPSFVADPQHPQSNARRTRRSLLPPGKHKHTHTHTIQSNRIIIENTYRSTYASTTIRYVSSKCMQFYTSYTIYMTPKRNSVFNQYIITHGARKWGSQRARCVCPAATIAENRTGENSANGQICSKSLQVINRTTA